MKATNNLDLEIGEQDIPISVYSAIEGETSFKQLSRCHNAAVNYQKVCSECKKELTPEQIYKALEIGKGEFKEVDASTVKAENTNLKVLGVTDDEFEENGYVKNGTTWFIGSQIDKKNKGKSERNLTKFAYLREALRESGKALVCAVAVRGKEHIVLVKPYFNAFVGVGVYYFEQVRDVKEISGYGLDVTTDKDTVSAMSEKMKQKPNVVLKDILNKRTKIIEDMALEMINQPEKTDTEKDKVEELVNF